MAKVIGKINEELRHYYGKTPKEQEAYACGFVSGQAEKIFLGACNAAMFRPSEDHFEWFLEEVIRIAGHYGLSATILPSYCEETPREIWIHDPSFEVGEWLGKSLNSEEWHHLRARACGIPNELVDFEYHLREGYGKRCD